MITRTPKAVFFATLSSKQNESQKYERDTRGISVTWIFREVPSTVAPSSRKIGNNDLRVVLPDMRTPHGLKPSVRGGRDPGE